VPAARFRASASSAVLKPALLSPACRIDAGEGEEVDHAEIARHLVVERRQRRLPERLAREERSAVVLQQPDDDLADDAAADGVEIFVSMRLFGFTLPSPKS